MRIVFQDSWCVRKAKREASFLTSAPNTRCTAPKVNDHLRGAIGPGLLLAAMVLVPAPDLILPLPCSGSSAWSPFSWKIKFPLTLHASAQQYRSFRSDCPHVLALPPPMWANFYSNTNSALRCPQWDLPQVLDPPGEGSMHPIFCVFTARVSTPHRAYSAFFCTNPKLFLLFYFSWCAVLLTSLSFLVKDKFLEVTLSCTLNPSHLIPAAHIQHSRYTCH